MKTKRDEMSDESCRIQESCELTFVQHFIAEKWWRRTHWIMGIAATIGATVTTALIFVNDGTPVSGIFGLVVAILAGLMTFLNPRDQAEKHHEKGVDYQQLVTNARVLVNIHLQETGDQKDFNARLQGLTDRKFELDRKLPVAPSGMIYWLAKRAVERGETKFSIDERSDLQEN
jgi:hypothetical protein